MCTQKFSILNDALNDVNWKSVLDGVASAAETTCKCCGLFLLSRCVIVVGLPYPSVKSAELREKMDYLNAHMVCIQYY